MENSLNFNFTTHLDSFKLQTQSEFQNGINAVWGKSGSGKTTFFNSLSGFLNTIEGDDNIDLKVILGKQFTNKIYVNTEFDINDFHNSKYQATYRLNKKTSIVGGVDVENKWHFRYRYKFYY